jgi:hypothetical protein
MKLAVGNWVKNDPFPSIVAIASTGQLRHYKVNSSGGLNTYVGIGTGWKSYDILMTNTDHSGIQGLLARYLGKLYYYPSDGMGRILIAKRVEVASSGWDQIKTITAVKGHNLSQLRAGLVYRNASGVIRYISSTGAGYGGVKAVKSEAYSNTSVLPNIRS